MTLSKKTKQEILDEYEKLQKQAEDLRSVAQTVHSQGAQELVEKTKAKTPQTIDKLFTDFQTTLQTHVIDMRTSLVDQSTLLQEIQKAIELSREQLELQHHITVSADALNLLMEEHTKQTLAFKIESEKRTHDLEEQITEKKKTWEREAEEYEYKKKLKQERDQMEQAEREKALSTRESVLKSQEQDLALMKKTIEQFPKELETAIEQREQEVTKQLTQEFAHEKALLEKETSAQVRLLELTVKHLEERLGVQEHELVSLKQQTEEANAKAQTLAIKAIERPTTIVAPAPATNTSTYRDQQGKN